MSSSLNSQPQWLFDPTIHLPSMRVTAECVLLVVVMLCYATTRAPCSPYGGAILVLSVGCFLEWRSPSAYYILSLTGPVFMGAQCYLAAGVPTAGQLACALLCTVICIGVPMSVCLHRYFSHQAFKTGRAVQFVLGITACLAWQGGPLWWAAMHIRHHRHCDKLQDPHSAVHRGSLYAVLGWMADPTNYTALHTDYSSLPVRMRTLEMRLLQQLHPIPPLALCMFICHLYDYVSMVWCCLLPMVATRVITLLFNLEFHPTHTDKMCKAADDNRVLAMLVGESRHQDHHARPRKARRPDLDLPWWLTLAWMQALGLIWDCK